jgi:hypothetical protein
MRCLHRPSAWYVGETFGKNHLLHLYLLNLRANRLFTVSTWVLLIGLAQSRYLLIGPRPDTRLFYSASYVEEPVRAIPESAFFDTLSNSAVTRIVVNLEDPFEFSHERFTLSAAGSSAAALPFHLTTYRHRIEGHELCCQSICPRASQLFDDCSH